MDKQNKEKRIEEIMHRYARAIIEVRDKAISEMNLYWGENSRGVQINLLPEEERIVEYAVIAKEELLELLNK